VVIEGRVSAYDAYYQLLSLQLPGTSLNIRVPHTPMDTGQALRCKVQARDVSLNLHSAGQSSILNRLPVTVVSEMNADNAAHVLIRLDAAGTPLLARITRYSRDHLNIHPGQQLWALIKAVAVLA
jgi:molybdate transport system ATP-binding protein